MSITQQELDRFDKLTDTIVKHNKLSVKLPKNWLFRRWCSGDKVYNVFDRINHGAIYLTNCEECIKHWHKYGGYIWRGHKKDCTDTINPEIKACYKIFRRHAQYIKSDFATKKILVDNDPEFLKRCIIEYVGHVCANEGTAFLPRSVCDAIGSESDSNFSRSQKWILAYITDLVKYYDYESESEHEHEHESESESESA